MVCLLHGFLTYATAIFVYVYIFLAYAQFRLLKCVLEILFDCVRMCSIMLDCLRYFYKLCEWTPFSISNS